MTTKDVAFNMRIGKNMYDKLKVISEEREKSMADFIRDAIREKIERESK